MQEEPKTEQPSSQPEGSVDAEPQQETAVPEEKPAE